MYQFRAITMFIASAFCITLGLFALIKNPKDRLNRSFAFLNFANAGVQLSGIARAFPMMGIMSPEASTMVFRGAFQLFGILLIYYFACFMQEMMGIYGQSASRIFRRIVMMTLILSIPFIFTSLIYKDFIVVEHIVGIAGTVDERFGVLFPIFMGLLGVGYCWIAWVTLLQFKNSTGIKRNQLKFLILAMALTVVALVAKGFSGRFPNIAWVTPILQIVVTFCLAYLIFNYRLFEFNLWTKRMAIYTGVYLTLFSFPFFLLWVFKWEFIQSHYGTPFLIASYGLLFSLAPAITSYIRDKSEQKKWTDLNHQLEFIRGATKKLADEKQASLGSVAEQSLDVLKTFYWNKMKNPLKFILVALKGGEDDVVFQYHPHIQIEKIILTKFIGIMNNSPDLASCKYFSRGNLLQMTSHENAQVMANYMQINSIEYCFPCVTQQNLIGVILLGAKGKGIFWPEELDTLHLLSSQVANAVRKLMLLERNKELMNLDELKTQLISNITHEFKTPLHVVENAIDILMNDEKKDRVDRERLRKYLIMIKNNAGVLGMFIQNLLEVARIEQSRVDLQLEKVNMKSIVETAIQILNPMAQQKGVDVRLEIQSNPEMELDVDKMNQVFCNLLSNALKFTEKGHVDISVTQKNGHLLTQVKDTGAGIDPQHLDTIFEKFFQDPSSKRLNNEGTGLGLAITKGWVGAHGGRVWAESDGIGRGATFCVELPISS